jgi:TolA-binding protein
MSPSCSGRQKDIAQGVDERLRRFEPVQVTVDGREFAADPAEQREFEAALAAFRKGEFPRAQSAFAEFLRKYATSGYKPTAMFWLGNAQYANRDYRGAIANFRALLQQSRTTRARRKRCCPSRTARSS